MSTFAAAFGDIVGPLFAALAFAGLIYTALMQRQELSLQREELSETKAELKRTADAQEASEKALQAQVAAAELAAKLNAATALFVYHREEMQRIIESNISGRSANSEAAEHAFEHHQRQSQTLRGQIEAIFTTQTTKAFGKEK